MAQSSGFGERGLDEDAFGDKSGLSGLKTFDAFRKLSFLIIKYPWHDSHLNLSHNCIGLSAN